MSENMVRYSVVEEKNKREIVLLRGSGCKWLKCRFCNYHLDKSKNIEENYVLNKSVLKNVTGKYKRLEVINSGSFVDLDNKTMELICQTCLDKGIEQIHFECHYSHRDEINKLREMFDKIGVSVNVKIGVETFDYLFRESYLVKGIYEESPEVISQNFDEVCLLFGLPGQTVESMTKDIETGLKYFQRVCVNIMVENGMIIKPDNSVIDRFIKEVYPKYIQNERVDILLNNTDFGVGGEN